MGSEHRLLREDLAGALGTLVRAGQQRIEAGRHVGNGTGGGAHLAQRRQRRSSTPLGARPDPRGWRARRPRRLGSLAWVGGKTARLVWQKRRLWRLPQSLGRALGFRRAAKAL